MVGKEWQDFKFDPVFQMVRMVAIIGFKRVRNFEPCERLVHLPN